ncbi:MAG: 2-amino-4-hydroxy-6-hydroxymethyldihydropteridine diphosphokinase [Gemmataceae bacterium]|nr:2-amino-4-hydroxy-6-hydroxymethyldihydropteridine diphosphokinase [Gemmataceae bacterium]
MAIALVALGSNLGERADQLNRAVENLRSQFPIRVLQRSGWIETDPVGGPPGQPPFLNGVVELETELKPHDLLHALLTVETAMGRVRTVVNAPRTVDLDLLIYDDLILDEPGLCLPHRRLTERFFVLIPLEQIGSGVMVPGTGLTIAEHLAKLTGLKPYGPDAQRPLRGKTIVVTGASTGIGRAGALELALAGADLVLHGRNSDRLEGVALLCRRRGAKVHTLLANLDSEGPKVLWDRFLKLDVIPEGWINNAGADILTGSGPGLSFDEKLEALWRVDVRSTLELSRLAGSLMVEKKGGVVINMGWDQAETGMEGDSGTLFGTTKGAVVMMTRALAADLAPKVRVHCVSPGWIKTKWGEHAPLAWQERVLRETPLARWGTAEDVAKAFVWLMSPASQYLTGQTVRVNGGAIRA